MKISIKTIGIAVFACATASVVCAAFALGVKIGSHSQPAVDSYNEQHPAASIQQGTHLISTGSWMGYPTYNYRFTGPHGDGDLTFPVMIDGHVFEGPLALADALTPVSKSGQAIKGMNCNLFCWNDDGVLVGYNPAAYNALLHGSETN